MAKSHNDDLLEIPAFLKRKISRKKSIPTSNVELLNKQEIVWNLEDWKKQKKQKAKVVEVKTVTAPKISIQQRIAEQVGEYIAQVENELDVFQQKYKSKFDMYKWLLKNNVKSPQASMIAEYYVPVLNELNEVKAKTDQQLNEAYDYLTKGNLDKMIEFVQMIVDDATRWSANTKKTTKTRKKRKRSVEQIIKHFKFKANDTSFKVQSVDPASIVGAKELWVLHTGFVKKIGVYRAIDRGGLNIDRSSIKNYDIANSTEKRIGRNPEETISKVLEGGKVTLRKLTDTLKAKDEEPTGRINKNIILLRVIK